MALTQTITPSKHNGESPQEADPANRIPEEPSSLPLPKVDLAAAATNGKKSTTEAQIEQLVDKMEKMHTTPVLGIDFTRAGKRPRHVSTLLDSVQLAKDEAKDSVGDPTMTNSRIQSECCGGTCCRLDAPGLEELRAMLKPGPGGAVIVPDNAAFKSLQLKIPPLSSQVRFAGVIPMPVQNRFITAISNDTVNHNSTVDVHPPAFIKAHPPYNVYSAKLRATRELTNPGAEKRTYHFDLDVTDYPNEIANVDFQVGGAIGVIAPNNPQTVEDIFNILEIGQEARNEPVILKTTGGRWPTMWGDEQARTLITTRRELLTWAVDVQSNPPTKQQLRVLAEYATSKDEKTILLYLCSKQGQASFCNLRTGPYITLLQLLKAFPSSKPPFDILLCTLEQLMLRFYSLSSDPHTGHKDQRRIIEIAVTVHEHDEPWGNGKRTGVGSGFFERQAKRFLESEARGVEPEIRIPMFRGLMANPLAREFKADGPMLLIGAGVGIAPFRGFVQRRLKNANCANKVWVLQGIRDSLLDELYSGEWGIHEDKIRKAVESRRGTGKYVQEEVRAQADLVWFIINSVDGRIFVCGSSKGMGEGVEAALIDVAVKKGGLRREEAIEFWRTKKEGLQYITETW